jgi:hypothetical protein
MAANVALVVVAVLVNPTDARIGARVVLSALTVIQ